MVTRAYAAVLRLYPVDYRSSFAGEMVTAFADAAADRCQRGPGAMIRFTAGELIGLTIGAGAEWIVKLTSDRSRRARCLPDPRMMRPAGVTRDQWLRNL
jgi:hypothetical protein